MAVIALNAPIVRVTVLEDRAIVERAGQVTVNAADDVVLLSGLSPLLADRTVRVEAQGATVVQARVTRQLTGISEQGARTDRTELQKRIEAETAIVQTLHDEVSMVESRLESLAETRTQLLNSMAELAAFGTAQASEWTQELTKLGRETAALEQRQVELTNRERRQSELLEELNAQERLNHARQPQAESNVYIHVDRPAQLTLRVSYVIPCAAWRPAYRATLNNDQVSVEQDAVIWQNTGEAWNNVELLVSTARPTLGLTPPTLREDVLRSRKKMTEEKRQVDVEFREEEIQTTGEPSAGGGGSTSSSVPGIDDGGEVQLLAARDRVSIASNGKPNRIALGSFQSPATVEHQAVPEKSQGVFVVAKFQNTAARPLMAGPVELIRGDRHNGSATLKFVAPNATTSLAFGVVDGVSILRRDDQKTDEAKLTGKRTTRHAVSLFVSNTSHSEVKLTIHERIPVSEVAEVQVQILNKECDPREVKATADGVVQIPVSFAAKSVKKLVLTWELSAAAKVAGV